MRGWLAVPLWLLLSCGVASAQSEGGGPLLWPPQLRFLDAPGPFLALRTEVGFPYARPRVILGYGQPWGNRVALEANPVVTSNRLAAYGGVRLATPWADLRLGTRYVWPTRDSYLVPREQYDRAESEADVLGRATYYTLEAEVRGRLVRPRAMLFSELEGRIVRGVPDGVYLFEQRMRAILEPPYGLRVRVGVGPYLGRQKVGYLGFVGELVWLVQRRRYVVRGGLLLRVWVSESTEIRVNVIPPLYSPDQVGLRGGDFSQLGIRHRWSKMLGP